MRGHALLQNISERCFLWLVGACSDVDGHIGAVKLHGGLGEGGRSCEEFEDDVSWAGEMVDDIAGLGVEDGGVWVVVFFDGRYRE